MGTARRPLRAELLFNLAFLTSAAIILVSLTTLLLGFEDVSSTFWALTVLWLSTTVIFVLFGLHLIGRLVLKPLRQLGDLVDRLATGTFPDDVPTFESEEFEHLGERFRRMTEQLVDAQTQVVRTEKLAGIGRLAAGVAHEIRNPLGAIGNYVEVLRNRGIEPAIIGQMAEEIGRIDGIVETLLDYSRPRAATEDADLNSVAEGTLEFLGRQGALKGVTVETRLARELPLVRGDRQALEQIVVNLVLNARDAAPGRRIEIGTVAKEFRPRSEERRNGDVSGPDSTLRHSAPRPWRADLGAGVPGALLYVADEGHGVPDEDRERVFDPFFSTKDPGKGVGLGLAVVARTVDESGGVIWVDRAREGGAVFKVVLPQVGAADALTDR
jgi:two-component system NtrC family sensor kinase